MVPRPLFVLLMAAQLGCLPALAGDYVLRVIDGDTLDVAGGRIRLSGIDAPERKQSCLRDGLAWDCGQAATETLRGKLKGALLDCVEEDRDRYGRIIATCFLDDGSDLNGWMVERGWAMAYRQYSKAYGAVEDDARSAKRGIWAAEVSSPWAWRAAQREAARARKKARP